MTTKQAALAAAAETLVGTPFRLHGRDPQTGLDCVGLCLTALQSIDHGIPIPAIYGLRNRDISQMLSFAQAAGLMECDGPILAGDIVLTQFDPVQFHLLIAAHHNRFIHAHAGLRRIVITPGPLAAPLIRHWRIADSC